MTKNPHMELAGNYHITHSGDEEMKPMELAEKIKKENEKQLGKMNEKKIALIIGKALEQIKNEIEETEEGRVAIVGLGAFNVRMIEREVEGTKETVKRIMFRPAKAK